MHNLPPPNIHRLGFVALALLVSVWLAIAPAQIAPAAQLAALLVLVVIFGLPHGALDPWIAEQLGWCQTFKQSVVFNLAYTVTTAAVVVVWLWQPLASLVIFLLISAWHFSGDWKSDLSAPYRVLAGITLLMLPIGLQTEAVAEIFGHLSGEQGQRLAYSLALPPWVLAATVLGLSAVALWHRKWLCASEYISLLVLAYVASPLVYFIIYFCGLHSPRHLSALFRRAPAALRPRLIRMALVYTLATVLLAGILWWYWSGLASDTLILRLVFIGLAAVTVPHMILIALAHLKTRTNLRQS